MTMWNQGFKGEMRGTWVVQLAKHLTLDFGSGHDLRVMRSSPKSGSTFSMESAWDSLSLSLSLSLCPSPYSHILSFFLNFIFNLFIC